MSKFTKVNVSGDGACYFHAVTGFLEMEKKIKTINNTNYTYYSKSVGKASALRKQVVNWLHNNLNYELPTGLTIYDDIQDDIKHNRRIKNKSIEGYLQYMRKVSGYAGQIEMVATANILNRSIRVYISKNGKYRNVGLGYEIPSSKGKEKDITLFHNMKPGKYKGDHYEILFPTSKANVVSKTKFESLQKSKKTTSKKKTSKKENVKPKRTKPKRTKRRTKRR